jgi:D-tyrosyl-tRNA(Tyr) deacylase
MKALLQRVDKASVAVNDRIVGSINQGLVALIGIAESDTEKDINYMVDKIINIRIFPDSNSKFNLSLKELDYAVLLISQFTLLADTKKGRRPNFIQAAPPERAEDMFNKLAKEIAAKGIIVQTGEFKQHMIVEIINNGPVTIMLDSKDKLL